MKEKDKKETVNKTSDWMVLGQGKSTESIVSPAMKGRKWTIDWNYNKTSKPSK